MKRLIAVILALFAMTGTGMAKNGDFRGHAGYSEMDVQGRFGMFYSSLSPYGEWIDGNFGYAWRPYHMGHVWRPYQDGRWVWTSYGWYWVSYEPFGWATFHYGRWYYDDYYGWIWIPGDVWGPAWVEWRYDNDYIGWAPLPPTALFNFSVGITFSDAWSAPVHYWNFVPYRNFTATRIGDYVQPIERNRRIFGSTRQTINIRAENNRVVNNGVDIGVVERRGNMKIRRIDVIDNTSGTGDRIMRENNRERLEIYRPRLDTRNGDIRQKRDMRRPDTPPAERRREGFDHQQPRLPGEENAATPGRRVEQSPQPGRRPEVKNSPPAERQYWIRSEQGGQHNATVDKPQGSRRPEGKSGGTSKERPRERKERTSSGRGHRP